MSDLIARTDPFALLGETERLRAEIERLRALFRELQTIVGHIEGINDERDSVPILIAVRRLVLDAIST